MYRYILQTYKKFLNSFFRFSRRKKIFLVVLVIALGVFIFLYSQNANKKSGYILERAKIASIREVVSESGEISSDGDIVVNSPTNGVVEELYVENGQQVTQGQDLFKVKSSATEQQKQAAYAAYLSAKADLDADTAELYSLQSTMFSAWKTYTDIATASTYQNADGSAKDVNRVLPEFTTAQDDWLVAEANYKNQQGVIAKDRAALNSASLSYQATQTATVKAPIDGTVSNISVGVGNSVVALTALTPSPKPVLAIASIGTVEAVIPIDQADISKVATGQKAVIRPDAYKDKKYNGTVVRTDSLGQNTLGVVTYKVYIKVEADKDIKPGMTLDGDIVTKELSNVLTVPNSAVVLYQGEKAVRVLGQKNTLVYIPVKVGVKGETRTEILSGIEEGREIVVSLTNLKVSRPSLLGL